MRQWLHDRTACIRTLQGRENASVQRLGGFARSTRSQIKPHKSPEIWRRDEPDPLRGTASHRLGSHENICRDPYLVSTGAGARQALTNGDNGGRRAFGQGEMTIVRRNLSSQRAPPRYRTGAPLQGRCAVPRPYLLVRMLGPCTSLSWKASSLRSPRASRLESDMTPAPQGMLRYGHQLPSARGPPAAADGPLHRHARILDNGFLRAQHVVEH